MPRTVAIIQARTGSTRLPRKAVARALGRPLLELMLERVKRAHSLDEIVLATTTLARDDELVEIAKAQGVATFRGSEEDVLSRYAGAARAERAEVIVRLTADCPLLDPAVVDRVVGAHEERDAHTDLLTNAPPRGRSFPDGMDVEVFSAEALASVERLALTPADREHVTRRLHCAPFRCEVVHLDPPAGSVRVTVDDPDDLERVRTIFEDLYPNNPSFGLQDVLCWVGHWN